MKFKSYTITLILFLSSSIMAQVMIDNTDQLNKARTQVTSIQGIAAVGGPLSNTGITVCNLCSCRSESCHY